MTAAAELTGSMRVWRPYVDEPLVTSAFLGGWASCDAETRQRLTAYLDALVKDRDVPVHTAVAFNAVYFGYDIASGGYVGGPLDIGAFPSVALGDEIDALPVGAMINIRTGGDLLPAEIIYKEGAHGQVEPFGDVPGWLSGAPSGARGPGLHTPEDTPVLQERLIFDSTAFGQEMAPTTERLLRLQRQGRTDPFGHLVVDARYTPSEVDLGDSDYYIRFLVTRGRAQLTSAIAPAPLPTLLAPGHREAELIDGVRGLMDAIRHALRSLAEARVWGEYAFTRASMASRLASTGPLGRDDLDRFARSTVRWAMRTGRRRSTLGPTPAYTAVGAALRSRPEWHDQIRGTRYPLAVCHANSVLADVARRESDESTGLLEGGVRLALDDRWQAGGIWRSVLESGVATQEAAPGPVDEPLGRGWAESLPIATAEGTRGAPRGLIGQWSVRVEPGVPTTGAGSGLSRPDDSDLGVLVELCVTESEVRWAVPLRLSHMRGRRLPLAEAVADELLGRRSAGSRMRVVLGIAGRALPHEVESHDVRLVKEEQPCLEGIVWPESFFPGIWITLSWAQGSSVVHGRTTLLEQPVIIDGQLVEHRYDPRVLARDGGPYPDDPGGAGLSCEAVLLMAVRRLGLLDQYGQAMLARVDVPEAASVVLDGIAVDVRGIQQALTEMIADRRLTVSRGSRSCSGRTYHPPRHGEPAEELVCYWPPVSPVRGGTVPEGEEASQPLSAGVREHTVGGFLRRIGHLGHQATDEQRARYREDHRRFLLTGPGELPPGFTYVRPHRRGH
ncbi:MULTISPECIES: hypothetical protein [unclassified Streptomyces]|uniref:hypothetical protein n=1 Tax=unclassified Streptomyces TaxID=2593676 RepID=UPI0037F3A22C